MKKHSSLIILAVVVLALNAMTLQGVLAQDSEPLHDVAVTNIELSKQIFPENYVLTVNVTVENKGNVTETFNVTLSWNTNEIGRQEITLENATSTVVTFIWNTAGRSKGNYTLKAEAIPVENEKLTEDNILETWVFITIPGDLNGDRTVDFLDSIVIGAAFGSKLGDENWNPNADVNDDGFINYIDVLKMGAHYNESW